MIFMSQEKEVLDQNNKPTNRWQDCGGGGRGQGRYGGDQSKGQDQDNRRQG